jgi:hypothetical protein
LQFWPISEILILIFWGPLQQYSRSGPTIVFRTYE